MRVNRSNTRRGVLLIVILGLLAMFALIAVAFVVLTGRALQGAKQGQRFDEYPKWPRRDLNRAFMQVVRGPNNTLSAMKAHCLLEDIYGYDPAGYTVANPGVLAGYTPALGGQLFEFNLTNSYRHVGCVLTMLDGAAVGQSTLIVGIDPTNDLPQALSFQQGVPADGDKFVINGAPFSGAGFGYDAVTGSLNATSGGGEPLALLPGALPQYPPGRANEDYDAVDFQNMLLAALIYTPGGDTGLGPFGAAGATVRVIPSLHRPSLIDYHINQGGGANIQNCLRPLPTDHPGFSGGNPGFNPVTGPWDVDNDGDGVPDSIWVDLAMPIRSAPDGRLYKPLFAILCIDLDGRLNLNAHGMSDQAQASSYQTVNDFYGNPLPCYAAASSEAPVAGAGQLRFADGGTGANQVYLPRGQGYGPAEINLLPLFEDPFNPGAYFMTEYQKLLFGSGVAGGRYGEVGSAKPGFSGVDDALSFNRHFGYPADYTNVALPTAYGTPPDLWGIMAVGVDLQGQPIFAALGGQWSPALADDPYEINLSPATTRGGLSASAGTPPADNPFSVTELERLLRPFDRDSAGLPARLRNLTFPGGQSASALHWRRYSITTESWNVPSPSPAIPRALRTQLGRWPRHVTDLLVAQNVPQPQWKYLLPPELLHGLKMNVNRPFGNRFDDDGNLVVDEPAEAAAGEQVSLYTSPSATTAFNVDHANDGPGGGPADEMVRQIYARHLFVLMMMLRDSGYQFDSATEGWSADEKREMTIRRIAQWAVNCVDFHDSDSIMTPFEYDEDPFDGWDVDGIIGSADDTQPHRGLVWGCERPELLLTEATGFHDRRVADTAHDNGDLPKGWMRTDDHNSDQIPDDDDLDQIQIPQGSAFFGLYCTRNHGNSAAPGDLYLHNGSEWVLDLGRMAPAGTTGDPKLQMPYPVWRMVITKSAIKEPAKNNIRQRLADCPDSASLETEQYAGQVFPSCQFSLLRGCTDGEVEIERIVWFANQQPNGHYDEDRIYYNRRAAAGLPPGRYAVVGPRAVTAIGSKKGSANLGDPSPQQIVLNPAGADPFTTTDSTGGGNYPNTSSEIQKPIGIIVAADPPTTWTDTANTAPEGIGINISEPLPSSASYYPEPTHQNPNTNLWDAYGDLTRVDVTALFRDEPLESVNSSLNTPLKEDSLTATGTTVNYKTVFLQRLADPTRPFDPAANPYRTVDWMPIDLTVFNGADTIPTGWPPAWAPPGFNEEWDLDDPSTNTKTVKFKTRQRGRAAANDFNIWAQVSDDPTDSNKAGASNHFDYNLEHTLGYINQPYWDTSGGPQWLSAGVPAEYRGDPTSPFPWLTWNNRPYSSELEMLLVPSSYPGRLLMEFDLAAGTPDPFTDYGQPFPHLLNFFTSEPSSVAGTSPQFHRVLEYLHVPSPFVGTRVPANAATCTAAGHWFHPPQNWISLYREPGRVNLNTIFSPDVFQGVMNYFPGMSDPVFWQKFVHSRRGYTATPQGNILALDQTSRYPTRFAAPFRSFAGGEMVPPLTSGVSLKPDGEVDATLLRRDPAHADRPLFQFDSVLKTETALTAQQFGPFNDPNRNPFFRYQGIQRLGNLVTTRSNVYAIWITVGYFEVSANPGGVDPAHPDGYRLGAELGSDTGDVERHRGFYIFDRSIPVGFDRGKDLNVENAVLLRRYIE